MNTNKALNSQTKFCWSCREAPMIASPLIAKKWNYYNDFDDNAVAWTKELIKRGLIPDGEVDGRSILDVDPADLAGFAQCHWFSGICGWSLALRLAGWPDDKPVWTGSPPCQPFSVAGKGLAADDPRHLGPAFVRLVRASRPDVLFGEQVASADVFGHVAGGSKRGATGEPRWTWIDDLFLRLEAARYAAWALDYPSASLGAPHIRQRTYFGAVRLADATPEQHDRAGRGGAGWGPEYPDGSTTDRLADADDARSQGRGEPGRERAAELPAGSGGLVGGLADADGRNPGAERQQRGGQHGFEQADGGAEWLANAMRAGQLPVAQRGIHCGEEGAGTRHGEPERCGADAHPEPATGPTYGPWGDADWLYCRDERWRPVESGTFPLAHGVSARVGRLRGYGNAINPWQAAHFIRTTYREPQSS